MTEAAARALPEGVTTPIPRALLRLALPVLASQMLRLGYQWVDALWCAGSASTRPAPSPPRCS